MTSLFTPGARYPLSPGLAVLATRAAARPSFAGTGKNELARTITGKLPATSKPKKATMDIKSLFTFRTTAPGSLAFDSAEAGACIGKFTKAFKEQKLLQGPREKIAYAIFLADPGKLVIPENYLTAAFGAGAAEKLNRTLRHQSDKFASDFDRTRWFSDLEVHLLKKALGEDEGAEFFLSSIAGKSVENHVRALDDKLASLGAPLLKNRIARSSLSLFQRPGEISLTSPRTSIAWSNPPSPPGQASILLGHPTEESGDDSWVARDAGSSASSLEEATPSMTWVTGLQTQSLAAEHPRKARMSSDTGDESTEISPLREAGTLVGHSASRSEDPVNDKKIESL